MCLGIPMKIMKMDRDTAVAGSGSLKRSVNITLMKNLRVGDYVLIHAGFAIEKLKTSEARKTIDTLKKLCDT